jgi:hypothetical protein
LAIFIWIGYVRPLSSPALTMPDFDRLSLSFVPNAGQSEAAVRYLAHSQGLGLYFTDSGLTFSGAGSGIEAAPVVSWHFLGAETAAINGSIPLPGVVNYLHGTDAAQWQTGLPTYAGVEYKAIYPEINAGFSGGPGFLAAVIEISPGADPALLKWQFSGAEPRVSESGNLELLDGSGQILLQFERPLAYQRSGGEIPARFHVAKSNYISLAVGPYDQTKTLEIRLAANLSEMIPTGIDVALDVVSIPQFQTIVTGYTSSRVFPTVSPLQAEVAGDADVFITKFTETGEVLFSTYLGGSSYDEGQSITVDSAGNPIFTGQTYSTDFPLQNEIMMDQPEADAFVAKLSADGSSLLYSTYLGGSSFEYGSEIIADNLDNLYLYGATISPDFPLLNPIQAEFGGNLDTYLTKISGSSGQLLFSTYLGGSDLDVQGGIDLDQSGNIFISGSTTSPDFPVANSAIPQPAIGFTRDVFVAKITADGSSLLFSALFGGTNEDVNTDLSIDPLGNAFVVGNTFSTDFPVVAPIQSVNNGTFDAFITRIAGDGSSILFSTYLGGHLEEYANSIVVGGAGNVFITGVTWSNDFPQLNPIHGMGYPGRGDTFVVRHSMVGNLIWSTYLGGNNLEFGNALDVDDVGRPVVVGSTYSSNFPLVNAFQTTLHGGPDAFVSRVNHAGTLLEFSTYLGGDSGYPGDPTDVTVSGMEATAKLNQAFYLLALGLLVLLLGGVWLVNRSRR